jgi:cysteine desulfurase
VTAPAPTRHYLDHASTSPPRPQVVAAMTRWLEETSGLVRGDEPAYGGAGDPGRVHLEGRSTRAVVEDARERVATMLGTRPRQVIFTSGGTEAVNSASWGAARAGAGCPMLFAAVEHSSVRESSLRLAPHVELSVDSTGRIDTTQLEEAIEKLRSSQEVQPALVHCQAANHEVGTLQPFEELVEICRRNEVLVHVDACAAAGHVPLSLDELGADMVSVTAHKFGGPPGVGALVVRRGLRIEPLLVGGDQERGRRPGLENVPAIVGFGAAAEVLADRALLEKEAERQRRLTDRLLETAMTVKDVEVLGDSERRVPHIVCVGVGGVEAEAVLLALDQSGISAHSGSSCSSESLAPSPVLEAMGADPERSLRLSVGWSSTDEDVAAFAAAFGSAVDRLRALR